MEDPSAVESQVATHTVRHGTEWSCIITFSARRRAFEVPEFLRLLCETKVNTVLIGPRSTTNYRDLDDSEEAVIKKIFHYSRMG